ncbi:Uncharacterized mitochondrial protein AtMg00710, partial [Striga hermonthica]
RRESGEPSTSSVLHTEPRGRSSTKESRHNKSNGRRSKSRNHRSSQNSKSIECWNYGKTGHYRNQCKSAPKNQEVKEEANITSTSGGDSLICSLENREESWVLDSEASFHATSQKELFENYVPINLVLEAFKIWNAMVENETGLKIKKLRSDNGGEYVTTRFKKFCYEHKIRMERTVPGMPQHNGVAEHMNRMLTERARSLRVHSGLPKQFWAEAVNVTTYLINRSPSVPLDHKLPEEVWSRKEVKLSHLRVFGCVAYVHISDQGKNKLDPKSKKCTFLGYGEDEFGYRLWDDENKKMIRSRDVIFNERVMYKDRHNTSANNSKASGLVYAEVEDILDIPIIKNPRSEESNEESGEQSETSTPTLVLRRTSRPHVPNRRYMDYMLLTDGGEPEDYKEACQTLDASKWELAMKDEI